MKSITPPIEEKKKAVGSYTVRRQVCKRRRLNELAETLRFTRRTKAQCDQRCARDPMYALFKRPETVLPRLLPRLLDLLQAKDAATQAQHSRMYREAIRFLRGQARVHVSTRIQLFFALLVLGREPEARAAVAPPGGALHFFEELAALVQGVLFRTPFGDTNVVFLVDRFLVCAELLYVTKWRA